MGYSRRTHTLSNGNIDVIFVIRLVFFSGSSSSNSGGGGGGDDGKILFSKDGIHPIIANIVSKSGGGIGIIVDGIFL